MSSYPVLPLGSRFHLAHQAFAQDPQVPQEFVASLVERLPHFAEQPHAIYTPQLTLWAFLVQVLSASQSCVAAVARVIALRVSLDLPPCSANTGAYCVARAKLPVAVLRELALEVGQRVDDQAPAGWRWHGRRVLLVDGFEVTAPDTPANQKAYPQPTSQEPGLGFPMIRAVVLLSLATASLIGAAFGPYAGKETGETALLRQLFSVLRPGDIVVADRYYCSYFMIALLQSYGVDVVFRLHQRRTCDFRRGRRLGQNDHLVSWPKPDRPDWMDAETYAAMPETLQMREIWYPVATPGCRSPSLYLATTLRDPDQVSQAALADLYHDRWHAEVDIRAIKRTLGLEPLSCRTPEMLERELWVTWLGYNLIRHALAEAARAKGWTPRRLSFAGALQTLEAFRWLLVLGSAEEWERGWRAVLVALGTHEVGNRPGRVEPRKKKRRDNKYGFLTEPREEARERIRRNPE